MELPSWAVNIHFYFQIDSTKLFYLKLVYQNNFCNTTFKMTFLEKPKSSGFPKY